MNLIECKKAILEGKKVYYRSTCEEVILIDNALHVKRIGDNSTRPVRSKHGLIGIRRVALFIK